MWKTGPATRRRRPGFIIGGLGRPARAAGTRAAGAPAAGFIIEGRRRWILSPSGAGGRRLGPVARRLRVEAAPARLTLPLRPGRPRPWPRPPGPGGPGRQRAEARGCGAAAVDRRITAVQQRASRKPQPAGAGTVWPRQRRGRRAAQAASGPTRRRAQRRHGRGLADHRDCGPAAAGQLASEAAARRVEAAAPGTFDLECPALAPAAGNANPGRERPDGLSLDRQCWK